MNSGLSDDFGLSADADAVLSKPAPQGSTALLMLRDGTIFYGLGFGAVATHVGELCFQTSMTGYQEIISDPSYAQQIVVFTFPHIGVVGTNDEDMEAPRPLLQGVVARGVMGDATNQRANQNLDSWLVHHNIPGICAIDTRALTHKIREQGNLDALLVHSPDGRFDLSRLAQELSAFGGIKGKELAIETGSHTAYQWHSSLLGDVPAFAAHPPSDSSLQQTLPPFRVAVLDYGVKHNILRHLRAQGCDVTVVPPTVTIDALYNQGTYFDGIVLANGPGDPLATATYGQQRETIRAMMDAKIPVMGICLGHELLGLALGCSTVKMKNGHHGANHPIKNIATGRVEITAQNHGFTLDPDTLPDHVSVTHISLFDQSIAGIQANNAPAFSVQYHPESSPGPHDSTYLFDYFVRLMQQKRTYDSANPNGATPDGADGVSRP